MNAQPSRDAIRRLAATNAPAAALLVRIAVGGIFLSEGIQKFLFPAELGVGRFEAIGLPAPGALAPFVGAVEIAGGLLVLVGLLTRLAAVALLIDMLVAIATTKIPILVQRGFWTMAHEARTDYAMLLCALFLLLVGAGPWSLDARLAPAEGGHRGPRDQVDGGPEPAIMGPDGFGQTEESETGRPSDPKID
jgi:uncharacterized membrane protein YphA (DoxX/SURF4 family)